MLNGSFVFFPSEQRRLLINFWRNGVPRFAFSDEGLGVLPGDCAGSLNHSMNTDLLRRMSCLPIIIRQSLIFSDDNLNEQSDGNFNEGLSVLSENIQVGSKGHTPFIYHSNLKRTSLIRTSLIPSRDCTLLSNLNPLALE
ncbi:uncharacterized protein CDAR_223401 [Caerostris darwini]|uniref:Ycf2 n=1 Tax=Caerostris darwini TaxID=1538125 RepID=A0AAV4W7R9_9ARAC|nr:uncharacterized protein CDAR_223401 [Caerostris darwini]